MAAKNLVESGFDVTVFEASDSLGGQWLTWSAGSGVWPGMQTNTSRAMTAFSDLADDHTLELHPSAEQIPRVPPPLRCDIRAGSRKWWL